ncbi:ephrin-A2-like [Clarias magur]|uniref:Ephrin-A2-like n=1 Tax=Clarias magur TaxID=1594786 RepID=A0A8J5C9M4_CLAMG|nr:ephrin-A2-like [Clarias magur]
MQDQNIAAHDLGTRSDPAHPIQQMELTLLMMLFWVTVWADDSKIISDRYAVYWNSTNPSLLHNGLCYTVHMVLAPYERERGFALAQSVAIFDLQTA